MVRKSLPYYYIITLWVVAFVSVFLIVKPLLYSQSEANLFSDMSISTPGNTNDEAAKKSNQNTVPVNNKKEDATDLVFYDKTAFIRYFSDKYSAEELSSNYNAAMGNNQNAVNKPSIKVVRKDTTAKPATTFSGSFDIKPLPGLKKN